MGPLAAAAAAELLADAGCELLVSFGTAGALDDSLASGDLLLTTQCRADAVHGPSDGGGLRPIAGQPPTASPPSPVMARAPRPEPTAAGLPPDGAVPTATAAPDAAPGAPAAPETPGGSAALRLLDALAAAVPATAARVVRQGRLVSVPQVVEGRAARRVLAERSGALAVDMESAAIAAVAHRRCLGFLAVRSIVDTVDTPLPRAITRHVDRFGRPRAGLVLALLGRPSLLPALLGLAWRMARARRTLTACAPVLAAAGYDRDPGDMIRPRRPGAHRP